MKTTQKPVAASFLLVLGLLIAPNVPRRLEADERVDYRIVRDVTYVERSGGAQTADLYLPQGVGPFPGVLMVHGGAWMAGNKQHSAWHARRLAQRGYAVMSINYRLAPQHPFPAQLEDCRAALGWMVQQAGQYPFDPARLAAYGYSAGGHLVCLLGMVESHRRGVDVGPPPVALRVSTERDMAEQPAGRLRAIVAGGAPCDFCDEPLESERLAFWLGGTRQVCPQAYHDASPTRFVTAQSPAVFFFHGQRDRVVPLSSPRQLFEQLRQQGIETQMHVVSKAGHLAAYMDGGAFEQSVQFLDRELRDPMEE